MVTTPKFPASSRFCETSFGLKMINPKDYGLAVSVQRIDVKVQAQTDRSDFLEDCLAELAVQAYR